MATYRKWSQEDLQIEASKYTSKYAFRKGSPAAYSAARRRQLLSSICTHMPLLVVPWTKDTARIEASKYLTRDELHKKASGAYEYINRVDMLDELFPHPWASLKKYTNLELAEEALRYSFRVDFKNNSPKHYMAARGYGVLNTICEHMQYKGRGFKKNLPAILYYFKIENVWKIGITNRPFTSRYNTVDRSKMTGITIQYYTHGYTAFDIEQEVIKRNCSFKATGVPPFTDGTLLTECFTKDIRILK